MTTIDTALLTDYDDECIFDVVVKLEQSFKIKFPRDAFADVNTLGELCTVFEEHIGYPHTADCTSQQAFYRIRNAMGNSGIIAPDSLLSTLFPVRNRRKRIRAFQSDLGIKVKLLRPPDWMLYVLTAGMVLSLLTFFADWKMALSGIILFILAGKAAHTFGKTLKFETVRELTQYLVQEKYMEVRRINGSINRAEIRRIIVDTLSRYLLIERKYLTQDARFSWAK